MENFELLITIAPLICGFLHSLRLYGEKIVIRILDRAEHTIELEKLGFQPSILDQFQRSY